MKLTNKIIVKGLFRVECYDDDGHIKSEFYRAADSEKCLDDVLKYVYESPANIVRAKVSDPNDPSLLRTAVWSVPVLGGTVTHAVRVYRVEAITRGR